MNYRRAAITAGAGAISLLMVGGTFAATIAVGYLLAANYLFGGGPPYAELLAVLGVPSAVGVSGYLITRALGGGGLRKWISAAVSFILARNAMHKALENTSTPDDTGLSLALMFLLVSALSILVATFHRTDINRSRTWGIVTLVILFVTAGFVGIVTTSSTSIRTSVLLMGGFAWVILPTLIALFIPPSSETQTLQDDREERGTL